MPLKMKVYVIIWSIPENGGLWSEEKIGRNSVSFHLLSKLLAVLRVKMTAGQWAEWKDDYTAFNSHKALLQIGITEERVL